MLIYSHIMCVYMYVGYVYRKKCKSENKGYQILNIKCDFMYNAGEKKICKNDDYKNHRNKSRKYEILLTKWTC